MSTAPSPCGFVHFAGMAHAVDRFSPNGPSGYRAQSGGALRETRAEAIDDECAHAHHEASA